MRKVSTLIFAMMVGAAACTDLITLDADSAVQPPRADASQPSAAVDSGQTTEASVCRSPEPPAIVMTSRSGEQQGAPGSFCAWGGGGPRCNNSLCADRGYDTHESTVVHPGDEVTFSMPDGTLMSGGSACMPECPPVLRIFVQDCKGQYREVQRTALNEDAPWLVSLPPGEYTLVADAHFTDEGGGGGGTSAIFGLIVDAERERGRAGPPRRSQGCKSAIVGFRDDIDAGM
ncbi:MAG TPA: hypothetical protein VFN67_09760 [Polyangiales bacterium]|nr:hypothetical protein [Polyangiales bacterium]